MALPPPSPRSTALVTGASSGIGVEIARLLAKRGHGVTLVARREDRLRELAEELSCANPISAEAIAADLSDPASRDALAAKVAENGLDVDVLVNNAGFGDQGDFADRDLDSLMRMLSVNIDALVDLQGRFLPAMLERGRGCVINVASNAAFQPIPGNAAYAASKAFVLSFGDAVHHELKGTGVTLTTVCPGPVRTEFMDVAGIPNAESQTPGFLWSTPEEVATAAIRGADRGSRAVLPGAINRATSVLGQHTPRALVLPLASRLFKLAE